METGGIRMHRIETKVYHADLDTDLIAFGENKCDAIWKKKQNYYRFINWHSSPSLKANSEVKTLTQECLDSMQSLLVGHQLRDDCQLAALAVVEGLFTGCLRSKTFSLAVERQ